MKDIAKQYIDKEIAVTPVTNKRPFVSGWQNIHDEKILSDEYNSFWNNANGIGILCGKPSGVICLDIDILENNERLAEVRRELLSILPPARIEFIGNPAKPPARFYKYSGIGNRKFKAIDVEILSTGNQKVIPPSTNPDSKTQYIWVGESLLDIDVDDLPELPDGVLEYLHNQNEAMKFFDKSGGGDKTLTSEKGRCKHGSHNVLSAYACAMVISGKPFEYVLSEILRKDREINKNEDSLYFNCHSRKDFATNNVEINAKKFVGEVFMRNASKIKEKEEKPFEKPEKRSDSYYDFKKWIESTYKDIRLCPMMKTAFCKKNGKWEPIENKIKSLKSMAHEQNISRIMVEDHLTRYIEDLEEKFLFDAPKYDGYDYISEMVSCLHITNIEMQYAIELFKEWCGLVFSRIKNPKNQNTMIILQGGQGIGKDTFFQHMFSSLGRYFSDVVLSERIKESAGDIAVNIVGNIPEFDETNKVSISSLKTLITTPKIVYRPPYAKKADVFDIKTSFVSSCNFANILRDSSGNRRFTIFEVKKIDWSFNHIDPNQILAQMIALSNENYVASSQARSLMNEYIKEETPEDVTDLIVEDMRARLINLMKTTPTFERDHKDGLNWAQISDAVIDISKRYKHGVRKVQTIVKKNFMKKSGNLRYYTPYKEGKEDSIFN